MTAPLNSAKSVSTQNADQNALPLIFHNPGVKYSSFGLMSADIVMFFCDNKIVKKYDSYILVCLICKINIWYSH